MSETTNLLFATTAASAQILTRALVDAFQKYDSNSSPNFFDSDTATPPDGAVVWVLPSYADAEIKATATHIRLDRGDCCLIIGMNEKFPYKQVLRQRAEEVLGKVGIIELPPLEVDKLSAELGSGNITLLESAFRQLSEGLEYKPLADKKSPAIAEPEVNQPVEIIAPQRWDDDLFELDLGSSLPEHVELNSPIDLKEIAELLDIPLGAWHKEVKKAAVYFSLRHLSNMYGTQMRVLSKAEAIRAITGDLEDRFRQLNDYIGGQGKRSEEFFYGLSFIIMLCHVTRKMNIILPRMYDEILRHFPRDPGMDRFRMVIMSLKAEMYINVQPSLAAKILPPLLANLPSDDAEESLLCTAVFLRVAVGAEWEHKSEVMERLRKIIGRLSAEESAAIGGAAFIAVSDVKQQMDDVM